MKINAEASWESIVWASIFNKQPVLIILLKLMKDPVIGLLGVVSTEETAMATRPPFSVLM